MRPVSRPAALLLVPLLLALVATLLTPPPAAAAEGAYAQRERQFLQLMNGARTSRGKARLAPSAELSDVARAWSRRMARDGDLRHNPRVSAQLPSGWRRWGENVGWASPGAEDQRSVTRRLHRAFMDSPGHRANVLGPFDQVGVGVVVDGDGRQWATMVFMRGPRRSQAMADAGRSPHRGAIATAVRRGLIDPCGTRRFCPGRQATRREVAEAVSRMLDLDPAAPGRFTDVTRSSAINALADAGIVQGCRSARFCPDRRTTRAQVASLLVRARPGLRPTRAAGFTDLPDGYVHAGAIGALTTAGVARGCAPDRFCPRRRVTRAQLASLVVGALRVRS